MKRSSAVVSMFVVACGVLFVMSLRQGEGASSQAKSGAKTANLSFKDLSGASYSLSDAQKRKATVFVFFSPQCPIAQKYAQRLIKLHEEFSAKGVRFFAVNSNAHESRAEVEQYAKDAGYAFPVVKDEGNVLADRLGAKMTPEAVVLDAKGAVRYRGRIDDNPSEERVTKRDLRDALDALLAGKPVPQAETQAFGCAIARLGPKKTDGKVTFYRDVLPIVQTHCQSCHRPGEIGPFPLLTYDHARPWAQLMKTYTQNRAMPPWKPESVSDLEYVGERRMTDKEIATLAAWVDEGAPEGNPKDAPPRREFTEGWYLGQPDLVLQPEKEYHLEAAGRDVYRHYVFPTDFSEDRYVTAIDVRPDNKRVVHHVIAFLDTSGRAK